jgi:hypothetical protein
MQQPQNDDPRDLSLGELAKQLAQDFSTLARQEIELAKAELTQKGKKFGLGGAMFGGAGVAGLMALAALTASLILLLALAIPGWVAALVVALVWAAVGGFLALRGRDKVKEASPPVPEQTVETVKEDIQWLKNRK